MDASQGPGRYPQAVEETENHLPESGEAEPNRQMQIHGRRHIQGGIFPSGMVSEVRHECRKLRAESENTRAQDKGPAGFGRSSCVLSREKYLILVLM